ncbi:MAG: PAS domain S-box protein, partial [Deltaproteobacteria bacterium]|nr:PAS domain S-box protein [Deltaproteobacteria bacterium]
DMIITTDLDRKIVSFNKGGELMLGYTQEEVLGMDVEKLYHESEERWALMRHVQDMGSISNYEVQLIHKNGHLLDISLTLSQLKDNQGRVIGTVGISKDITPQKEQEEKLRLQRIELQETRDYLANILENTEDMIVTTDLDTKIVSFNHGGKIILGYEPDEVIGRSAEMFYPGPEERRALIRRVMREGSVSDYETQLSHKDGHPVDINLTLSQLKDNEGRVIGTVGISKDITRHKTLEKELMQSNWRFRQFIDLAHDMIVIKDLEGRYLVINPRAAELFGMKAEDCVGKTDFELLPHDLAVILTRKDREAMEKGEYTNLEEALVINDEKRFFNTVRFPLLDYKGDRMGICAISREITEQKDLQQAIIQSEKMAAVGKLAASIAHEINNPMTGILTFAEELKSEADPSDPRFEDYETIVREALRCRGIVRDLLDYARLEEPERQSININLIIERSITLVRQQALFHDVKFTLDLGKALPDLEIDPNQMQQVFLNLIINAGEAMDNSGTIFIQSRITSNQRSVQATVKDEGHGIPGGNLSRIFDPFYSTKGQKGNGLGLSVVQTIIEQHEGNISVASQVGEGTTFSVLLPINSNRGR